jgi:hypothetical protein
MKKRVLLYKKKKGNSSVWGSSRDRVRIFRADILGAREEKK